jgi:hypothetical protein
MTDLFDHPEQNLTGPVAFVHIIEAGDITLEAVSLEDTRVKFPYFDNGLRWIHVPENDLTLVQVGADSPKHVGFENIPC